MWTDHLRAVGVMLVGIAAIALFIWLAFLTKGLIVFAAVILLILSGVYVLVLDQVKEYRRKKARDRAFEEKYGSP